MQMKFHPSFWIYLFCIAILSSLYDCLALIAALLIHELGHYAAAELVGEQIAMLEITPCGGVMIYKQGACPHKGMKGILVHSAGPAANWLFLLTAGIPACQRISNPALMHSLFLANVSMLVINLLPVLPLDGGHVIFCLFYYFFPVSGLVRCLSFLGMISGIAGIALCIYGLIYHQVFNCSLAIISFYLVISEGNHRRMLLCENIYTVIHERMLSEHQIRKKVTYQVSPDTILLDLIDLLKQNISVSFVFYEKQKMLELTEEEFCRALLTMQTATVRNAYLCGKKGKENSFSSENTVFPS